ncbi:MULTISPECIES: RDD family protein [Planktothricoides]|uniref:RDD family protein n=1 Tax=Planktothricoides raciborskii FACHB-1370 TaxID=2949576 RepID=A0ABR8EBS5_9CYAN|nr:MULTISPECIES: RDD family protein [Planktothricoides]KOR37608.1 hypothetical protein AM228_05410 [Planktothricoides sp. SR001]MBD2544015.1 RDD family protein [Planktothricoides raciborskii FACHB-1370]MBD2582499.1 RDD family protein [Planktothricoides raciborskii FACHB-1261]
MSRTSHYAGINKRFVAILIDSIFLTFAYLLAGVKAPDIFAENFQPDQKYFIYTILTSIVGWIYFAGMESSDLQATFGKRLLGIIVTDTQGNKISFARATGRYFAKSSCVLVWIVALIAVFIAYKAGDDSPYWVVALLIFLGGLLLGTIGYLMAAFTPEKQALHDIMARCLVVNGSGQSITIPWKLIIGLAIAAILSGRIIDAIPTDTNTTNTGTTEITLDPGNTDTDTTGTDTKVPSEIVIPPEARQFLQETPSPTENNPNIPTSGRFTVCGSEEQLLEYDNVVIDGDWKFQFSNGAGAIHIARIKMQGDSGIMRVVFPDPSEAGGFGKVQQTMHLYRSSQGLVVLGFNPMNPETGNPVTSYQPDKFLIRQEFDGSTTVRNCGDGGDGSPVNVEPYLN